MTFNQSKLIRHYQDRVFNWQRDVAGQPVTDDPAKRVAEFVAKQHSFVRSEWFGEYVPHAQDYHRMCAFATVSNGPIMSESRLKNDVKDLDDQRLLLADDIADTAFTILGYVNAVGLKLDRIIVDQSWRDGVSKLEWDISITINSLNDAELVRIPSIASVAMTKLHELSKRLGFGFFKALEAVCDSNDTKLWTPKEVQERKTEIAEKRYRATEINVVGQRTYRVINEDMKLIKSPSFEPPNLFDSLHV